MTRNWHVFRDLKAARQQGLDVAASFRQADKLRPALRMASSEARMLARELDLEHHLRLKEKIDRASSARRAQSRIQLPVISAEDLVVLKILAGRGKDLDDVEGILLRKGKALDRKAVASRLRELEDLLGQSDLLPVFDKLASEIRSRRPKRRRAARE